MLTRGSKTTAEKVARESESGPDMGSPDRRESIPPVTDMQVRAQFPKQLSQPHTMLMSHMKFVAVQGNVRNVTHRLHSTGQRAQSIVAEHFSCSL